jgi:hydantoinase/carbamoylase family amidase
MGLRRDALAAAAEAMLALERIARTSSSGTTVGTVGVIRARPGAINVVPGEVELDVDVRDSDEAAREAVVAAFLQETRTIGAARGVAVDVAEIVIDTPTPCAANVVAAAVGACEALGLSHRRMISGAYHDAMIVGSEIPMGMVFVPSRGGVSHHPDEYTSPEQIDQGVDVLAAMLAELAA